MRTCLIVCLVVSSLGDAYCGGVCGGRRHGLPAGARPSGLQLFLPSGGTGGWWHFFSVSFVGAVCFCVPYIVVFLHVLLCDDV